MHHPFSVCAVLPTLSIEVYVPPSYASRKEGSGSIGRTLMGHATEPFYMLPFLTGASAPAPLVVQGLDVHPRLRATLSSTGL